MISTIILGILSILVLFVLWGTVCCPIIYLIFGAPEYKRVTTHGEFGPKKTRMVDHGNTETLPFARHVGAAFCAIYAMILGFIALVGAIWLIGFAVETLILPVLFL